MITTNNTVNTDDGNLVTEASSIGLKVNEWPEVLSTTFGNGTPFYQRSKVLDEDNDIMLVEYLQKGTLLKLQIFND